MAKTLNANADPKGTEAARGAEIDPGAGTRNVQETSALVDEDARRLSAEDDVNTTTRPVYKRPAFLIGAVIVLLVVAIFGIRYWLYARSHETTDDAFVDGHIIQVSTKASGYVARIYVTDNQQVNAGDLLAELDARDYEAKVTQAKAALDAGLAQQHQAQTQVTLTRANTRSNVQQAAAGVRQARSEVGERRPTPPPNAAGSARLPPAYRARWQMSINLGPNLPPLWRRPRAPAPTCAVIKSFTAKTRSRDNNSMLLSPPHAQPMHR